MVTVVAEPVFVPSVAVTWKESLLTFACVCTYSSFASLICPMVQDEMVIPGLSTICRRPLDGGVVTVNPIVASSIPASVADSMAGVIDSVPPSATESVPTVTVGGNASTEFTVMLSVYAEVVVVPSVTVNCRLSVVEAVPS